MRVDERGEVFPVAILFGGVLLTILIGVHVVLVSIARTAAQSAADSGVVAAQAAPLGGEGMSSCGTMHHAASGDSVTPTSERECQGMLAAWNAMDTSGASIQQAQPPVVSVDDDRGVVSVISFGVVQSPVLGNIEVFGYACGPLDNVEDGRPTPAALYAC